MHSATEENYIKVLYRAENELGGYVSNGEMARRMRSKRSSVTDMLQKLGEKSLVRYRKYRGAKLTKKGRAVALKIIRRHRLWEVFLVDKLGYPWEEIHPIAEQLEHVNGPELSDRLDAFLNYPECDPHGEGIPKADGKGVEVKGCALASLKEGEGGQVVAMQDDSKEFLAYMNLLEIRIGTLIKVEAIIPHDQSRFVTIGGEARQLSHTTALHILVKK